MSPSAKPFFGSLSFWFSILGPFFVFFLILIIKKNSEKQNSNTKLVKNKNASKLVRKSFSEAKSYLDDGNNSAFFEEITRAIWNYFSDKLNIPAADLNKDNVKDLLMKQEISENEIDELLNIVEECELARYAPVAVESDVKMIYEKASSLIEKFEAKL